MPRSSNHIIDINDLYSLITSTQTKISDYNVANMEYQNENKLENLKNEIKLEIYRDIVHLLEY